MKKPKPYLEWTARLSAEEIKIMVKHGWRVIATNGAWVTLVYSPK